MQVSELAAMRSELAHLIDRIDRAINQEQKKPTKNDQIKVAKAISKRNRKIILKK